MARTMTKFNFRSRPEYVPAGYVINGGEPLGPMPCRTFGGGCKADGCVHWLPVPSAWYGQDGQCLLERGNEQIHRSEALRKAAQYRRCADNPNSPVTLIADLGRAAQWGKVAEMAPVRATSQPPPSGDR